MSSTVNSARIGFSFRDLPMTSKLLLVLFFVEAIGGALSYHIAYFFSAISSFNKLNIGFLGFFMGLGSILGGIGGGFLAEKIQSKNLIGMSFLSIGLAFIGLSNVDTFNVSCFLVLLMGFGINVFITCSNSSLLQISKNISHSLTITQSYKNALENAGSIVAMILLMFLAQHYFKSALMLVGIAFILFSIPIFQKLDIGDHVVDTKSTDKKEVTKAHSPLAFMLFSVFCIGLIYGIQKTVLGVHLNETLGDPFVIGLFFATDPILITLFQVKVSKKIEKFNKHIVVCTGSVLLGISTLALGFSSTLLEMFGSLLLFTLGEMLFMTHSVTLCHEYGSGNYKGLGIGAWRSSYALGMMIGPLVSGFAMYYYDAKSAWIISSSICLLSAYLLFYTRRR